MREARAASDRWRVAVPDLVLLTLNAMGVRSYRGKQRERLMLCLDSRPHETWLVIVSFGQAQSPFTLDDESLLLGDDHVGVLVSSEPDDTSISYFRKERRVLTLNSNARSRCTGCAFCPNLLEDRADSRLGEDAEMVLFLSVLIAENGWSDLSPVECVTVCTGCFSFEPLAVRHMRAVRASLDATGFGGTLQFLTSVVRTERGLAALADLGPFHLTLTIECFTRRADVLKRSKADLGLDDMERILRAAHGLGIKTDYTYVVGLDPLEEAIAGIARLRDVTSTFPRLQVYQPHNAAMAAYRTLGAERLDYYLEFRAGVEKTFADTSLAPETWENYRSPWYTHFGERCIGGIRI